MDFTYHFTAPTGEAECRVRIFRRGADWVFVVTELPDNPGMSVTNAIEQIATNLVRTYGLHPERTTFIEHYPEREIVEGFLAEETFDIVTFRWECDQRGRPYAVGPKWRRISKKEAERLTGSKL